MVVKFTQLSAVLTGGVERGGNTRVNGCPMAEDVVGYDNTGGCKEFSLHDHIVVFNVIPLIRIDENDIEHSVKSGDATV